jgi:hypothetical protein
VDCGPIGYLSIAAHGHADALSLYLSVAGREFLIDPGTYAYHSKTLWRNYFRGTSAHNTVRIDSQDQSVIGGNFMWLKKAVATCDHWESTPEKDCFSGHHNGYRRLKDPILHRRRVEYLKNENKIIVIDDLACRKAHLAERFWHFSEECDVKVLGRKLIARNGGIGITIEPSDPECAIGLHRGDEVMPSGWVSRRYDVKAPSWSSVFSNSIHGNRQLTTTITFSF